jgi:15-cis-phytoene synthase
MTLNDAAHCRQIVRTHARTFWLASRFLPPQKRRAAFALYAFCRVADDIVDVGAPNPASDVAQRLLSYRAQLDAALDGRPGGSVFRELSAATEQYDVPASVLHELLDGVARDCAPIAYARWSELSRYCEGVASSVGEMCAHVFGVPADAALRARALSHARTLGVAMQLTNILRDVGDDARNGRCYIPYEDLERFGLTSDQVLRGALGASEQWKALMRFEISRARELYAQAMPGIALLAADARRCATACAVGYAGILGAIEEIGYDTFSSRARLSTMARAGVLWNAWRTPLGRAAALGGGVPVNDSELVTST